jgi:hypothetical protein
MRASASRSRRSQPAPRVAKPPSKFTGISYLLSAVWKRKDVPVEKEAPVAQTQTTQKDVPDYVMTDVQRKALRHAKAKGSQSSGLSSGGNIRRKADAVVVQIAPSKKLGNAHPHPHAPSSSPSYSDSSPAYSSSGKYLTASEMVKGKGSAGVVPVGSGSSGCSGTGSSSRDRDSRDRDAWDRDARDSRDRDQWDQRDQRSKKNSQVQVVQVEPALPRQHSYTYDYSGTAPSTGRSNASTHSTHSAHSTHSISSGCTTVEDSPSGSRSGGSSGSGSGSPSPTYAPYAPYGTSALGRVSGLTSMLTGRTSMKTVEEGRSNISGKSSDSGSTAGEGNIGKGNIGSTGSKGNIGKPLCCDKCDGKHPTDDCPHYKKKRDDHPDARKQKNMGVLSNLPGASLYAYDARVIRQPGDGSCLFHSMSYSLRFTNATKLRAEICAFVAQNPKLKICDTPLQDWVKWDSGSSVGEYARKMSRGSWGGGIEMACVSHLKDCNVHVYERSGGGFKRISAFDTPDCPEKKQIIKVLYCGGVHYDALV